MKTIEDIATLEGLKVILYNHFRTDVGIISAVPYNCYINVVAFI